MPQPLLNITPPRSPGKGLYKSKVEQETNGSQHASLKSHIDDQLGVSGTPHNTSASVADYPQHSQFTPVSDRCLGNNWRRTESSDINDNHKNNNKVYQITPPSYNSTTQGKHPAANTTLQTGGDEMRLIITQAMMDSSHGYAIQRPDGRVVRLIPTDQLPAPFQMQVKSASHDRLILLPSLSASGFVSDYHAQPYEQQEHRTRDAIFGATDVPQTAQSDVNCIGNGAQQSFQHTRNQGVISRIPPFNPDGRPPKIYCDMWLFKGICGFTQQGCKFKHEMPMDRLTQEKVGLNSGLPDWYKRKQTVEFISQPAARSTGSIMNAPVSRGASYGIDIGNSNSHIYNPQPSSFTLTLAERQKMNGTSTRQIGSMGLLPTVRQPDVIPNRMPEYPTRSARTDESPTASRHDLPEPFPAPLSPPAFSPDTELFDSKYWTRDRPASSQPLRADSNTVSVDRDVATTRSYDPTQPIARPQFSTSPSYNMPASTNTIINTTQLPKSIPSSKPSGTRFALASGGVSLTCKNPYGDLNCFEDEEECENEE